MSSGLRLHRALITFLILWFSDLTNQTDLMPWYVAAAVIGAIASFCWPVVAGNLAGTAAPGHERGDQIQKEVDRQMAEQNATLRPNDPPSTPQAPPARPEEARPPAPRVMRRSDG